MNGIEQFSMTLFYLDRIRR